jgi:hypothetical protein
MRFVEPSFLLLPTQQHMDMTVAVAHPGGGDLPDTFTQMSLPTEITLAILRTKGYGRFSPA